LLTGMLHQGYLRIGRLSGIDLRIHWSLPVGALVFTRARFEPVLWLSFLLVILVHELGHAWAVKRSGFSVSGIDVTGLGGHCRWRGRASNLERAWIAWGGVLAQMLLLVLTLSARAIWGPPESRSALLASEAFIGINLWIAALNLVPFAPLDGADAWRLFGELERAGWTLKGFLLRPLLRWARDRRAARLSEDPAPPETEPPAESGRTASPAAEAESGATQTERDLPKPSAQAQRELAALLERIGDEAGKAKRRR
jgi:stage IV sporulation protein FB